MQNREEFLNNIFDEIVEYALQQHREGSMTEEEKEDWEREKNLAEEVEAYLDSLEEEKKELLDDYISAIHSVNYNNYKAMLLFGFRAGMKLSKWIDSKSK